MNKHDLLQIKYLVIDVDGTMTDAGIYYDENGNETKKFCSKDAAGYFAAKQLGIKLMVLTGRECQAVTRRMEEMKFDYIIQNIKDKVAYLQNFVEENKLNWCEIGYLGDDLNDLKCMLLCGFAGCPNDACEEIKQVADYISSARGGQGAVRDIIKFILQSRGQWAEAISNVYGTGI